MESIMEMTTSDVASEGFAMALELIADQSQDKQTHFMAMVVLLSKAYLLDDHKCVLIADTVDSMQIVSANANDMEAAGLLMQATERMVGFVGHDAPEHLN